MRHYLANASGICSNNEALPGEHGTSFRAVSILAWIFTFTHLPCEVEKLPYLPQTQSGAALRVQIHRNQLHKNETNQLRLPVMAQCMPHSMRRGWWDVIAPARAPRHPACSPTQA